MDALRTGIFALLRLPQSFPRRLPHAAATAQGEAAKFRFPGATTTLPYPKRVFEVLPLPLRAAEEL